MKKLEIPEDVIKKQFRKMLNWKYPESRKTPKNDVDRIYVRREMGGSGLISYIGMEENKLGWHVKNSAKLPIEGVEAAKTLEYGDTINKNEFIKT